MNSDSNNVLFVLIYLLALLLLHLIISIYSYIHKGPYPVYRGRPPTVVDWELNKREAVVSKHKEIHGNSLLLMQLRSKVKFCLFLSLCGYFMLFVIVDC